MESGDIAEVISQLSDLVPRQFQKKSQEINYGRLSQNDQSIKQSSNFLLESSEEYDEEDDLSRLN